METMGNGRNHQSHKEGCKTAEESERQMKSGNISDLVQQLKVKVVFI